MKEGVEESYRLRANMLRQEAKIAEQLKSIEIDRLKRLGKAIRAANQIREYCAMCDLQFYGHLSTHRKSEGHLDLKKFLHPKCEDCSTEFHNRTEFDDHLLSPIHMKTSKTPPSYKSEESRKNRLQILTETDEVQGLREEKPKKEKVKDAKDGEATSVEGELRAEGTESVETDTNAMQTESEVEVKQEVEEGDEGEPQNEQTESEPPILDFTEGDDIGPEIENKIPKYNCKRQVGSSLVSKLVCFECRLCNKYFDTEATAEIHSRTYNHHRLFVKFLNEKANETKIAQKRAAAAAEETERLKRIKLEIEEPSAEEASKSELYDPTQATGEDEPKENGSTESTDVAMTEVSSVPVTEEKQAEEIKPIVVEEPVVVETPPVQEAPVQVTPAPVPVAAATAPIVPTPAPIVTSTPAPVVQQSPAQNQQQQPQQQNNTPKQFNNRGRGGRNNNNRRGRYGGRY